mgnify:FL=1
MLPEAKLWFDLAEDDYQNAMLLWENHRYGATVFFLQQSVEKILKAYIVEDKRKLPRKTHRIEVLIKDAGLDLKRIDSPNVEELSKAYIRVRYPDLSRQYYQSRTRVEPLVNLAKKVYLWVKKEFKKA